MSTGFHGRSTEEIVELRFKEYEIRKAREREELAELKRAREKNKADVTQPKPAPAPAPNAHPLLNKWKHMLHLH